MSERIGAYRVERRLGRGGMGEVLLAWDDRLERRVAIKRIRQDSGLSPEQRERFRREARLAARLSHSAVVQIHDLVTEGSEDAIVMEYVEGDTLTECLQSGPLPLDMALRLGREIAEGLAAAHDAGLIHRDLKAANVIVTRSGRAKILDFGLARPVIRESDEDQLTRQGMVIGTLHAMSPEQARGEDLDARSDLFSLGSLLFEMLTGRAPFRGRTPVDTLRRVVHEPAPDPRALRPDLPAEVADLLDRLLAKDRRDRPAGAGELVVALERLRPGSGLAAPLLHPDTVSDQPTAPARAAEAAPILSRTEPSGSLSSVILPLRRRWRLLTLPLLGVLLAFFSWSKILERPPIRVYMPEPAHSADDESLNVAASAVHAAGVGLLSSLEGISAIDPAWVQSDSGSPEELARETAADELLLARVVREGGMGHVWLRRVRVTDSTVLGAHDFQVSLAPDEQSQLARAVALNLQQKVYPRHPPRPGTPELDVREEEYSSFMRIRRELDSGKIQSAQALSQLEEIILHAPGFLEARLLAAEVALALFPSTRHPDLLDTARTHIREAQEISPNDPRTILVKLRAARTQNNLEDAEAAVKELDRLLPGDPEVLVQKALLREHQGRLDEAVAALRTAAKRAPAWRTLLHLAQLEAQTGNLGEARHHFNEILRQKPGNPWTLGHWGRMEMLYGDLRKAEEIYTDLVKSEAPSFPRLTSLGLVHTLRGQHRQAAINYRRALEMAPENPEAILNLADTERDLGRAAEAQVLYRQALRKIDEREPAAGLSPRDALIKAQCLARLGRGPEAVDLTQRALHESPDDPQTHFQAALVFSITGDRNSGINSARKALAKGISARWFTLSAFGAVRDDPELRSLLAKSAGS